MEFGVNKKTNITSRQDITEKGVYALDATENNPEAEGSLRQIMESMSANKAGYYKIGPFYVYHVYTQEKNGFKITGMGAHDAGFFFGEANHYAFNGTLSSVSAVVRYETNPVTFTFGDNNSGALVKIVPWSSMVMLSTCQLNITNVTI